MSEQTWAAPVGLVPGARIAGYVLEEQIGQGGMAVVFRARDARLDRQVALKFLAPYLAADAEFRRRFDRESRLAAAVDDPHIIPVLQADDVGGVLFIAMRYARGGDVASLVRRQGALPPARVVDIVSQVASALDNAHRRGLVHRDVKPSNVLLDSGEQYYVYLSDFGIAKTTAGSHITRTGQFLGTLAYTAPEQIIGKPVDGRTDQYALACTAYHMLSGEPPFTGDDVAVLNGHLNRPTPPLTSRLAHLPAAVDAVFARALAKDPAERYPTCREFSGALLGALRAVPPTRRVPVPDPKQGPDPAPPPRRAWLRALVAAGAGVAAGVGLVIWAPWSGSSVRPPTALAVGAASTNSVTLDWSDPGPSPSQYEVWQNGVAIASVSGNAQSYQIQGLDPDTTYQYQVQAIRGSDRSVRSSVLTVSTQSPPLSTAQIEGPWQVQFTVVTASTDDEDFSTEGKTWTVQWTFSPECTVTACVGTLSGDIYESNGEFTATVDRSGDGYVAYVNVDDLEYCDYTDYGDEYPTTDQITIALAPTRAQAEGKSWSATAWDGTFTMLSQYNPANSSTSCPEYTVEANVASPAGG